MIERSSIKLVQALGILKHKKIMCENHINMQMHLNPPLVEKQE